MTDAVERFKEMYARGDLSLSEFETRVEDALNGRPHARCDGYMMAVLGGPDRCPDCGGAA